MHLVRLLLAVLGLCALTGCAGRIPDPQPQWAQATGQIQSTGGKLAIVGDIVIRHDPENFLAEISKGPSSPLLRLYAKGAHGEKVTAHVPGRGGWSGSPASAPGVFKSWAVLPEVFQWAQSQAKGSNAVALQTPGIQPSVRTSGKKVTYLEYRIGEERILCRLQ